MITERSVGTSFAAGLPEGLQLARAFTSLSGTFGVSLTG